MASFGRSQARGSQGQRASPCSAHALDRLQTCWPASVHDRFAGRWWIKARSVAVFREGGGLVPIVA